MPDTFVQVTPGAGTKRHTVSRTVGADTVHEEIEFLSPFGDEARGAFMGHGYNGNLFAQNGWWLVRFSTAGNSRPFYGYINRITARATAPTGVSAIVIPIQVAIATGGVGDNTGSSLPGP